jgi:hypothetical protein
MRLDPCCCGALCSLTVRHPGYSTSCVERMDWMHVQLVVFASATGPRPLLSDHCTVSQYRFRYCPLHHPHHAGQNRDIVASHQISSWPSLPLFLRSPRAPAYLPLVVVLIAWWCIGDLGPAALGRVFVVAANPITADLSSAKGIATCQRGVRHFGNTTCVPLVREPWPCFAPKTLNCPVRSKVEFVACLCGLYHAS